MQRQFTEHSYLPIRNYYTDDIVGQRTGFKTRYSEHLIGWGHWIGRTVLLRPEVRYERAYDVAAHDNGRKMNQLMLASDLSFFF